MRHIPFKGVVMDITDAQVEKFAQGCCQEQTLENLFDRAVIEFKSMGFLGMSYHYIPHMGSVDYKIDKSIYTSDYSDQTTKDAWAKMYLDKYRLRPDPFEDYFLKSGQAVWAEDMLDAEDFQGEDQQDYLRRGLKTFGHSICVPVFGPRRSRGVVFLLLGSVCEKPSLRIMCFVEYMCFCFHRMYCKIRADSIKPANLTPREHDVLRLIPLGLTNREIGIVLGISANTVNGYLKQLFIKLDAPDRLTASLRAFSLDLID